MSTHAVSIATPRAARLLGPAFTIGGLLWIGDFVQIVVYGLISGTLVDAPDQELPLALRIGLRLFVLSVVILGLGMAGLFLRVQRRSKKLAIAALPFMIIALALATANLVTLSGLLGAPFFKDTFMGLSVFSTSIATLLMGIGTLRSGVLPRWASLALVFVGVTTIPILFGTPLPVGPDWATDHLAFLTSGIAFAAVGVSEWRGKRS
jgi:hypothetical protein